MLHNFNRQQDVHPKSVPAASNELPSDLSRSRPSSSCSNDSTTLEQCADVQYVFYALTSVFNINSFIKGSKNETRLVNVK